MTKEEACSRYKIPPELLDEYERWGLCGTVKKVMGAWQYDDSDLKNLSLIMTLHEIGFTSDEAETYMTLLLKQDKSAEDDRQRLRMLQSKRGRLLDEIHFKEKYLSRLDYLAYQIEKNNKKSKRSRCRV